MRIVVSFEVKDLDFFLILIFEVSLFLIGGNIVGELGEENFCNFFVELLFLLLGFFSDFKSFFGGVLFLLIYGGINDVVEFVFDKIEEFFLCCWVWKFVFGWLVFFVWFKGFLYLFILILICFLLIIFILSKGWLFCLNGVRLVMLDFF